MQVTSYNHFSPLNLQILPLPLLFITFCFWWGGGGRCENKGSRFQGVGGYHTPAVLWFVKEEIHTSEKKKERTFHFEIRFFVALMSYTVFFKM